jgi:hypothetical protein
MVAHDTISYTQATIVDSDPVNLGQNPNFFDPAEPIGYCNTGPFTNHTFSETFTLQIGGVDETNTVRTNQWSQTSTSPHAGTLTNNNDVTVVVP